MRLMIKNANLSCGGTISLSRPCWAKAVRSLAFPLAVLLILTFVLLPAVLHPAEAAEIDQADLAKALEEVYARGDFQEDLPSGEGEGAVREGEGEAPSNSPERNPFSEELDLIGLGDFAEVLELLLWVALAVVVIFALYSLFQTLDRWGQKRPQRNDKEAEPARRVAIDTNEIFDSATLAEADRLAASGNYSEAVHAILIFSIDSLRTKLDLILNPSLTAREVVETVPIKEGERSALHLIVSKSELFHFGGRLANAADYAACRQSFLAFSGEGRR